MIVPILALAGSMAAKRRVAPSLGTFPTTGVLWTVLLIGVVIIVGALTFFPALVARARSSSSCSRTPERSSSMSLDPPLQSVDLGRGTRRFQRFVTLGGAKPVRRAAAAARRLRPRPAAGGAAAGVPQARSAAAHQEPGHVRGRDHGRARDAHRDRQRDRHAAGDGTGRPGLPGPDRDLAVVHRPVRDLRRGRGRGARPGPGRHPAQDPLGDDRASTPGRRLARGRRLVRAAQGRHHRRRGRRDDPRRRRRHRGRRLRQRGGHHRRVRAGPQGARHRHPQLA